MASLEAKVSKKRRQDGDPEASKRKQKKQKKESLPTEIVRESSLGRDEEHHDNKGLNVDADPAATESTQPKKDKKKKKPKTEDPLPADIDAGTAHDVSEGSPEKSKKSKKSKKDRSASDASAPATDRLTPPPTADETKPKKSKKRDAGSSQMSPEAVPETNGARHRDADASPVKSKKSKKKKRDGNEDEEATVQHPESTTDTLEAKTKKRKDRSREIQATPPPSQPHSSQRLDPDSPSTKRTPKSKTAKSSAPPPPVVMQEVARWVPLWPRGWHQPITAAIEQHFTPKLHRYDGDMGGVLLGYDNVCLNDRPTRKGAATQDNEAVKLLSVNEFGVGFCWLIADLELFLPKRGSWMEGELILQNQGHVGVVCWDKFNASIESSRLPPKWSWVAAPEDGLADEDFNMDLDGNEDGEQVASATPLGYWVDEDGNKVEGKLRFRIKNYDVGLSGDHSFLCIEGTMLDETEENRLREKELKLAAGAKGGIKRRPQRVLPEFSMTDLGVDEEAEKAKRWRKEPPTEEQEPGDGVEEEAGPGAEEGAEEGFAEEAEAIDVVEEDD